MDILRLYNIYKKSTGVSTDTRTIESGQLFFALSGPNFNGNLYADKALEAGALAVVVDDKTVVKDDRYVMVDNTLSALQDLARHHRRAWGKTVIGLTGSNGKTTTKEFIYSVLSQHFNVLATKGNLNNHIGVPLTLLSIGESHEIAVIEMGANHAGEIALLSSIAEPNVGMITNIGAAHLEGFGSLEGVAKAKTELYDFIRESEGKILLNVDDARLVEKAQNIEIALTYGAKGTKANIQGHAMSKPEGMCFELTVDGEDCGMIQTHVVGTYNLPNALAAIAIGKLMGMPLDIIAKGLSSYKPSNNRSQLELVKGVSLILDAYNANPSSVSSALINLSDYEFNGEKGAVLGGMRELGEYSGDEHEKIVKQCLKMDLKLAIFVGSEFEKALRNAPKHFHYFPDREHWFYCNFYWGELYV